MTRPTVWVAVVGGLLALPVGAGAQHTPNVGEGRIVGSIYEAGTGVPVVSVEVSLASDGDDGATSTGSDVRLRTSTDAQGRYAFTGLEPGRYRLDFSRLGYADTGFWVELGGPTTLERSARMMLEPVALHRLEVAIPRPWQGLTRPVNRAPGAPDLGVRPAPESWYRIDAFGLDPASVAATSSMGEPDVFRALQQLPGVSGQGDFAAAFWTRGGPWGTTQITLDGLPLFNPLHGGGLVAGVTSESLRRVTLFPGVRPASLAEGAAGLLSLETGRARDDARPIAGLSVAAARLHVEERVANDRIGVSFTGRRSWWDAFGISSIGPWGNGQVDYAFADASVRLDWRLSERWSLDAGGLDAADRLRGRIAGLVDDSWGDWGNRSGWTSLRYQGDAWHVSAYMGATDYGMETRPGRSATQALGNGMNPLSIAEGRIDYRTTRFEVGGKGLVGRLARHWSWRAGLDFTDRTMSQRTLAASQRSLPGRDSPWELSQRRAWFESTLDVGPVKLDVGSGFHGFSETLASSAGWTPSATISWRIAPRVRTEVGIGRSQQLLYPVAAIGKAVGPQLATGFLWAGADSLLPAVISDVATASLSVDLGRGFSSRMTVYRRNTGGVWMNGLVALKEGQPQPAWTTPGSGRERALGIETAIQKEGGSVTGSIAYSSSSARLYGEPGVEWASPSDRPHSLEALIFGHLTERITVGTALTAESGWPAVTGKLTPCEGALCDPGVPFLTDLRTTRAPSFVSLDLLMDWRWVRPGVSFAVTGSIRNFLGRDNSAAYGFNGCETRDLFGLLCTAQPGEGTFSPGLTGPTPTISLRVLF